MRAFMTASILLLLTTSCRSSFRCPEPFPVTVPTTFHWGCPTVEKPALATPANTSITNQANGNLSVLFSATTVNLQQHTTALTGSATAFLAFPITTNASQPTGVTCHVRGFLSKSELASASIFIDLGGTSALLQFPAGTAVDHDIIKEISLTVPATQPQSWPLTVVITAQRPDTTNVVNAIVEDVTCALTSPGS